MEPGNDNKQMTEAVGVVISEVLVVISHVVNALRQQPGFDSAAFDAELKKVAESEDTSVLQKHAMTMLLEKQSS